MTDPSPPGRRLQFGWLCLGYLAVVLYASTIVGPSGCNFVPSDPVAMLQRFLAIRFVPHGSDQRADWIGNLLMLLPFGFLCAGALWPRRRALKWPAAIIALTIALATILGIKYLQLFFPPRTVTLNYIVAQSLGAVIGCSGFAIWQERLAPSFRQQNASAALRLTLRLYLAALLVFLLMPLDFALNATDLWAQMQRLPGTVLMLPGGDRPPSVRALVIAVAIAAFIPVGPLLAFRRASARPRTLLAVMAIGLAINIGIFAASALVIGAKPAMPAVLYRTGGIMIGAAAARRLTRFGLVRFHRWLHALLPWMIAPYLLVVLLVNGLLSFHWLSPHAALQQLYPLGFLPLFDYYIVSKAAAAKNIVGHALLYSPVGVGLWLRSGAPRGSRVFTLAAALAFAAELARYFRPGLAGDLNVVAVAGASAWIAARLMPKIWSMLLALASPEPIALQRRVRLPLPAGEA